MIWVSSGEAPGRRDEMEVSLGGEAGDKVVDDGHMMDVGMLLEAGLIFM